VGWVDFVVIAGLPMVRAESVSDAGNDLVNAEKRERRHCDRILRRGVWAPGKRLDGQCWTISRFRIHPNGAPHVLE
jgi:hypothetical protein